MNVTTLIINIMAIFGLLIAFAKDKDKAIQSLKIAGKSFIRMLPMIFIFLLFVRPLPRGREYARGGGWVRFKYFLTQKIQGCSREEGNPSYSGRKSFQAEQE